MTLLSYCGFYTSFISVSLLLRKGETLLPILPLFFWPCALSRARFASFRRLRRTVFGVHPQMLFWGAGNIQRIAR